MALKSYILTQDYRSPYVRMTGLPQKPQEVRFKQFKKGEVVAGELKHANNQPAFVLVKGVLVFPLSVVKELVTKDVVTSNAEGDKSSSEAKTSDKKMTITTPKLKIMDAVILGGLVGYGATYLAEKQNWIVSTDKKNRLIGAGIGAVLFAYVTYRIKNK